MAKTPPSPGNRNAASGQDVEAVLGLEKNASATRRWMRRLLWTLLALAALAALYAFWFLSGGQTNVRYTAQPVTRGNLTIIVTATGSVEPTNQVEISSELSGTVRRVLVDYNSEVERGQPLAELDTDKLRATVQSSRAKLNAAKAKVAEAVATIEEAQASYERKKALVERRATSATELEAAKAAYDRAVAGKASALAEVAVAEADLTLDETNLGKAAITSPIKGVVLTRNVDPGQTVASSLQAPTLFTIAEDLTQMELQVDIDEADVGKVKLGQKTTFGVDAYPNRRFPAEIRDIRFASEVVQNVVTYKGLLSVDNSDLLLRPGMTATAEIVVEEVQDALLVPNAALRFSPPAEEDETASSSRSILRSIIPSMPRFRAASRQEETGSNRTLWILRDGEPVAVEVVIGATDGSRTQILKGEIQAGEQAILDTTTSS